MHLTAGLVLFGTLMLGAASGYEMSMGVSEMFINGHRISIVSQPDPQLSIDGEKVPWTSAGSIQNGTDYTEYTKFPKVPDLVIRLYKSGGYYIHYASSTVTSNTHNLTDEDKVAMEQAFQATRQVVNNIQSQINEMNRHMDLMFSKMRMPTWPMV